MTLKFEPFVLHCEVGIELDYGTSNTAPNLYTIVRCGTSLLRLGFWLPLLPAVSVNQALPP